MITTYRVIVVDMLAGAHRDLRAILTTEEIHTKEEPTKYN